MVSLFQVYQLVARVEKASVFSKPCHARREDSLLRHNEVIDITATILSDVCKDVELESFLLTLNGEEQTMRKTAKTNDEG